MTNGNSFGRNALLTIIFLLAAYVFLQILQVKISFWIWIVLLMAIFFVSLLLTMKSKVSISSKLSTSSITTILVRLLWLVVIISALLLVLECLSYLGGLGSEHFHDDTTMKDYEYKGNFVIQDESLKIRGTATIFNSDASDNFLWIPLYWESPDFDIFGTGKGTIKIVIDNGIQRYEKEISVDGPFRIEFGTGASWEREDVVYFIVNDISSTNNNPPTYFDTDRPYSVKVDFTGAFNVFEINIGE